MEPWWSFIRIKDVILIDDSDIILEIAILTEKYKQKQNVLNYNKPLL